MTRAAVVRQYLAWLQGKQSSLEAARAYLAGLLPRADGPTLEPLAVAIHGDA